MPATDKVLKLVVKNKLMEYLEGNNLINEVHHGFRAKHNYETATEPVLSSWKKAIDHSDTVIVALLDLKISKVSPGWYKSG